MNTSTVNPVNSLIGIAVGWFLLAFLHSAAVSLFSAGWTDLIPRFKAIAYFHNKQGAIIDVIIIVAIYIISNVIWYIVHHR